MELAELLPQNAVHVTTTATSKKRLLQEVARLAGDIYHLPSAEVFRALQDRESLGPTGMGHGVAVPHARLPGLDKVWGLFLRLDKGIEFDAIDRQPVDLVFALFAPENAGAEHLKALARVSRTLRDANVCAKLRTAPNDPAVLYTILTETPASQAA